MKVYTFGNDPRVFATKDGAFTIARECYGAERTDSQVAGLIVAHELVHDADLCWGTPRRLRICPDVEGLE